MVRKKMYYGEYEKKRSFKWIYLIVIMAFFIWVMSDELSGNSKIETIVNVELPK